MRVVLFICFLTVLFSFQVDKRHPLVQNKSDQILWSKSYKLSWDDFEGRVDSMSNYEAMTYVQIGLKSKILKNEIIIDIPTYFYKNLSWTKKKQSNLLLLHEQLHFNIAELIGRKIRKSYSSFECSSIDSCFTDLKIIYRKFYSNELDSINRLYDTETNHGLIAEKQKEWEKKIATELKKLEAFSNTKVVIKRVKK